VVSLESSHLMICWVRFFLLFVLVS
ncbi:tRNA-5-carboxymethylaminomethyl-2-thiouridine(34) synthesis protein MnmE, partial [uncultured Gammaproteobacteria bacterium]